MREMLDACWNGSGSRELSSQGAPDASAVENLNPFSLAACEATREQFLELAAIVKQASHIFDEFREQHEYLTLVSKLIIH